MNQVRGNPVHVRTGLTAAHQGTKRKRVHDVKYYAVRSGYKPGVYSTWAECQQQVKGYKKALFKSFYNQSEAVRYATGDLATPHERTNSKPAQEFFAVRRGRLPGIYQTWPSVQEQITGWKDPEYNSFDTYAEAQSYLHGHRTREALHPLPEDAAESHLSRPATLSEHEVMLLDKDSDRKSLGSGPLPQGSEDGFDPNIVLDPIRGEIVVKTEEQKLLTKPKNHSVRCVRIYTDGSSLRNGMSGAAAGIGVYFGLQDPRNVSEPLQGAKQTNQRAELYAISRALEILPDHRDTVIVTDSKYSIDCLTNWYRAWRRNGWKNSVGKAVENKEIIESILKKIELRGRAHALTDFEWVKGHTSDEGNVAADKLAVAGARKAPQDSLVN